MKISKMSENKEKLIEDIKDLAVKFWTLNLNSSFVDELRLILDDNNNQINSVIPHKSTKFTPPFRVGRKQNRAVLDSNAKELVIFPKGQEQMANNYCDFLNAINNKK